MANIRAFQGFRPRADLAHRIAALPYDVYNRQEAKEEVQKEPLSFLRVDRAETGFSDEVDTYAPCVYERARDTLWDMVKEGQFIQDETPCYYIYELIMQQREQTGIVACASIDDYEDGVIKKHENTRAEKEEDRIRHVDTCDMQTGPIFLAYRSCEELNRIVAKKKLETPVYDFISEDQVSHRVWVVNEPDIVQRIQELFASISQIYIADGHHRAASAVKVGQKRRKEHPDAAKERESDYFLSVLFPDEQLKILDYNRVVRDLNGHTEEEFLDLLRERFEVSLCTQSPAKPEEKGAFTMFLDDKWYLLQIKKEFISSDPVDSLDVSLLQNHLLRPILGIDDPKTDTRIDFVGGIRGLPELERRVKSDCQVAFAMYPTSIEELFQVADANRLMPPKSTWFEPKLRSGLLIHELV